MNLYIAKLKSHNKSQTYIFFNLQLKHNADNFQDYLLYVGLVTDDIPL